MSNDNRNKGLIRAHLEGKSADQLTTLLANLLQGGDERMVGVFWEEVAPATLNRARLSYGSPELFLAQLEQFAKEVEELKYFDEEIQERYDEHRYNDYDEDDYGFGFVATLAAPRKLPHTPRLRGAASVGCGVWRVIIRRHACCPG